MSILCADPVWSAYALADQQPQLAPYCRWLLSAQEDEPGVVLFFDGLTPPVLFAAGSSAGVAAALKGQGLPDAVYLSVLPEHLPGLAWHWEWGELRPMWRMVLVGPQPVGALPAGYHFRPLKQVDLSAVEALFAHGGPFTPDAFAAHQLELGPFYAAVDADGRLAAIGGTHVVDPQHAICALGNFYTRPDCRGQGLATALLGLLVAQLRASCITTIVLNVDQRNRAAERIYRRSGFAIHCGYFEGTATLRAPQGDFVGIDSRCGGG